jgi:hypothetical protein
MKNFLFSILFSVCVSMLMSCGNQSANSKSSEQPKSEQADKKESGKKSPVGTYSAVEDGKPMQFVLKEDGTGFENYQGTENRPFKWRSKTEGIFFTYDGEAQEWQLPVDIEKGEISYGSLIYKKE